jgi:hypothetical protein
MHLNCKPLPKYFNKPKGNVAETECTESKEQVLEARRRDVIGTHVPQLTLSTESRIQTDRSLPLTAVHNILKHLAARHFLKILTGNSAFGRGFLLSAKQ